MHSLLGPQFDAEIAYRQERARREFARARHDRTGLSRLLSRDRHPVAPERHERVEH